MILSSFSRYVGGKGDSGIMFDVTVNFAKVWERNARGYMRKIFGMGSTGTTKAEER